MKCGICLNPIADDEYFYTINAAGGYGRPEFLCCDACIREPENSGLRDRMIKNADCKELA